MFSLGLESLVDRRIKLKIVISEVDSTELLSVINFKVLPRPKRKKTSGFLHITVELTLKITES